MLMALHRELPTTCLKYVPPTSWKGTIDGDMKLLQIERELSEDELLCMRPKNEHTLDAAGIGLWWLKRTR
jgi:hypothetical protein